MYEVKLWSCLPVDNLNNSSIDFVSNDSAILLQDIGLLVKWTQQTV